METEKHFEILKEIFLLKYKKHKLKAVGIRPFYGVLDARSKFNRETKTFELDYFGSEGCEVEPVKRPTYAS